MATYFEMTAKNPKLGSVKNQLPLSVFAHLAKRHGPQKVERQNQMASGGLSARRQWFDR
jgi:hypothetical protein